MERGCIARRQSHCIIRDHEGEVGSPHLGSDLREELELESWKDLNGRAMPIS